MNAQQMQAFRPYAQGQQRGAPASRRPGELESDARTNIDSRDRIVNVPYVSFYSGTPGVYIPPRYSQSSPAQLQKMAYPAGYPGYLQQWGLPTPAQTPYRPTQHRDAFPEYMTPYFQPVQGQYLPAHFQNLPAYNGSYLTTGQVPATAQQYAAQQAHLQQQRQQQQQAVLEHQHAQRRAKKPTDKNMPDGVEDMIIGEGVQQYKELREQERRLDYAIMRKRLDLTDSFNRSNKRQKTLRLWISNTADNQPWQRNGLEEDAFDFTSTEQSTARIKIEGRIIDDPDDDIMDSDDEESEDKQKPVKTPPQKMSQFFKSMSVEFDKHRNNVPDPGWQVEWKKQQGNDVDVIYFRRPCDENVNININFVRDDTPEKYKLSPILAETLDMAEGDRPEVVMGIWEYVKCMDLQEDEDKRMVRCDDQLRQIFGVEQIYFPQIPDRIMPHLHPLDPVKLPYTVRVDQEFSNEPKATVYDIRVPIEDPLKARVVAMMQNPELHAGLRQIAQLDEQLAVIVQALQHSKARHTFFKSMSKDPGGFVNKWVKSQRRDLEVILGEAARGGGEDATGPEFARGGKDGVWGSEPVHEAVRYMLAKPQATKA